MSTSVCWELTCDGLVSCPGEVKTLIRLTLQKQELSAGSKGHLARKGLAFFSPLPTRSHVACANLYLMFSFTYFLRNVTKILLPKLIKTLNQIRLIFTNICLEKWKIITNKRWVTHVFNLKLLVNVSSLNRYFISLHKPWVIKVKIS